MHLFSQYKCWARFIGATWNSTLSINDSHRQFVDLFVVQRLLRLPDCEIVAYLGFFLKKNDKRLILFIILCEFFVQLRFFLGGRLAIKLYAKRFLSFILLCVFVFFLACERYKTKTTDYKLAIRLSWKIINH